MAIDILTLAAARAGKGGGGSASKYAQPDWGAEEVVLLPETEIAFAMNEDLGMDCAFVELSQALSADTSYTINFNGTVYNCKAIASESGEIIVGNAAALGGAGNDEPFMLLDMGGVNIVIPLDGSTSATMSVASVAFHSIPVDYLDVKNPLIVTEKNGTPSVSYDKIIEAIREGKTVYFEKPAGSIYNLAGASASQINFLGAYAIEFDSTLRGLEVCIIFNNDTVKYQSVSFNNT